MRIFITGGTGFVGKPLVDLLKDDQLLILTTSSQKSPYKTVKYLKGSLGSIDRWSKVVQKFKPEVTVHMAWEGIPDYGIENSLKNLKYGLDLYTFLSQINCQTIISTGSCWEYGNSQGKLSEETLPKPFNAFTSSKTSLFWLGQEVTKDKDINFIWTRLFYVYGPGQKSQSLIPYLINCAKNKQTPGIKNPDAQNDFIYIEDLAEAIAQIIKKGKKSGIYNIGSGKLTSVKEIIQIISDEFNLKKPFKKASSKQTDSLSSFYANISKIQKEIGWEPKTTIKQGIIKTIQSIK